MKLFVSIFACIVALATAKTALQHELEHKLDLAQGPLVAAMFDYQNRGYRHFVKILTKDLNQITLLRGMVHEMNNETDIAAGKSLNDNVEALIKEIPKTIKDPAPNEMLKAHGLYLAQIDLYEKTDESKKGRPEKLKQLVEHIVADEAAFASMASGILSPDALKLKKDMSEKYEELSKMVFNQKIPTIDEIQMFIPVTQKKIDSMKFLPDSIAQALFWTEILNGYKFLSYSMAQMLPLDNAQKVDIYYHGIGEFHKLLTGLYHFDMEGVRNFNL